MGSLLIVIRPPRLDCFPGFFQRFEPVHVQVTCPPNPDPVPMRVPTGRGAAQETLEDEADKAFGGTDRDQAA